jgi:hypothetical protein
MHITLVLDFVPTEAALPFQTEGQRIIGGIRDKVFVTMFGPQRN